MLKHSGIILLTIISKLSNSPHVTSIYDYPLKLPGEETIPEFLQKCLNCLSPHTEITE